VPSFYKAAAGAALVCAGTLGVGSAASAGSPGQNPAYCGAGESWSYRDFNIKGKIMRQELRHGWGCGTVGWSRLTQIGGSGPPLAVIQSVWNPGGASQGGVSGTNYTYTVNATSGLEVCGGTQAYWIDSAGRWNYIGWFFAGCYRG